MWSLFSSRLPFKTSETMLSPYRARERGPSAGGCWFSPIRARLQVEMLKESHGVPLRRHQPAKSKAQRTPFLRRSNDRDTPDVPIPKERQHIARAVRLR